MIEFVEQTHTYVVDGIIVPSVTQVVGWQMGDEYSTVPSAVLKRAADYGTRMHEWLHHYFRSGERLACTDTMLLSIEQLERVFAGHTVEFVEAEKPIAYQRRFAGTFDLLIVLDGEMTLIDHKTTLKLHTESLEWQCGCYKVGIKETLGIDVQQCKCLWLPKAKPVKLVDVAERSEAEINSMMDRWDSEHE